MIKIRLFDSDEREIVTKEVEFLPDYIVYKGEVHIQSDSVPTYYVCNGSTLLEEHLH